MPVTQRSAHRLIAETARSMAHELYDTMMGDNLWYVAWKQRFPGLGPKGLEAKFVAMNAGKLLPGAREVLTGMLSLASTPPEMKDQIAEALILDSGLRMGRMGKMKPSTEVLRRVTQ